MSELFPAQYHEKLRLQIAPFRFAQILEYLNERYYRFSQEDQLQEAVFLKELGYEFHVKRKKGFVVGRFQPLHPGHEYLIESALTIAETVDIAIGTANPKLGDPKNPFSFEQRLYMLRTYLARRGLTSRVNKIIGINDTEFSEEGDGLWFNNVIKLFGIPDIVVGNNDWVNDIFMKKGIDARSLRELHRSRNEGTKIRTYLYGLGLLESFFS